jgi:hypothetical protein
MDIASLLNRPPPLPRTPRPHPEPEPDLDGDDCARSSAYTLLDDLSILRVVTAYYGPAFCGKIPWSFWQTYKRVTGSSRSNSSLYHHWNGAMKRKYDAFLSSGQLSECIGWLETATAANRRQEQPAGAPLIHHRSEPPVPLGAAAGRDGEVRPLVRTNSHMAQSCAGNPGVDFFKGF